MTESIFGQAKKYWWWGGGNTVDLTAQMMSVRVLWRRTNLEPGGRGGGSPALVGWCLNVPIPVGLSGACDVIAILPANKRSMMTLCIGVGLNCTCSLVKLLIYRTL